MDLDSNSNFSSIVLKLRWKGFPLSPNFRNPEGILKHIQLIITFEPHITLSRPIKILILA